MCFAIVAPSGSIVAPLWLDHGPPWPRENLPDCVKLYFFRNSGTLGLDNGPFWLDRDPLWLDTAPLWLDCGLLRLDKKLHRPISANF